MGALAVMLGYLLGAIPFGYLLVRGRSGRDVRAAGSGSIGATNVTRAAGPALGALTLLLDLAKGYAAVEVASRLAAGDARWMATAGLAAIVGHSFPVFLHFRGGKGVATGVGVFAYFTPLPLLAAVAIWLVVVAIWRYVSLGSILAAAAYPVLAMAFEQPPFAVSGAGVAGACLIIVRHYANIRRLIDSTEPKLEFKPKK
ncbi:MAG TPA: glycerol-3-phosphate 1-O-acyltransferase PlsY [Candidatus Xenobia bacterium]|nr:glycerol-3-phosphate 1-O-acyltransferase PlsY [Candidatus Xenobia bacterium]